jgi:hypothetical protein
VKAVVHLTVAMVHQAVPVMVAEAIEVHQVVPVVEIMDHPEGLAIADHLQEDPEAEAILHPAVQAAPIHPQVLPVADLPA